MPSGQNRRALQSVKKAANRQNEVLMIGGLYHLRQRIKEDDPVTRQAQSACCARHFDLLRKPKDYRTYVRRRLRFACLVGFIDLCQSVKKEFFDRLRVIPKLG
jgi:hypothetical protein